MSNKIKLSIVIPIYNRETSLVPCVENVLSQDYKNFELILVNDASTDSTEGICKTYAQKYANVSYVTNNENLGPGLTRNVGLDKATGDYIIFLDSDDKYDKKLFSTVVKAIEKRHPDILVYSLWEEYYNADGQLMYKNSHSLPSTHLTEKEDIHRFAVLLEEETMLGYPWNKAYNLDYLRKCKARFTDIKHVEDILFNIDAFENASSLVVLEDKLYRYCNTADNRLTEKYLPEYFELQKKRIKKFYNQQKRFGTLDRYCLSVLAGEYYRWLLSAVERQINAEIPEEEISSFLRDEFKSKLFRKLRNYLDVGPKLRVLYLPIYNCNVKGTIFIAGKVSLVKNGMPGVFSVLKQNR